MGKVSAVCPYCHANINIDASSGIFKCCYCHKVSSLPKKRQQQQRGYGGTVSVTIQQQQQIDGRPSVRCPHPGCDTIMFYSANQKMIRCPGCTKVMMTPSINPGGMLPHLHQQQAHSAQIAQMQRMQMQQAQNYATTLQNVSHQNNLQMSQINNQLEALMSNEQQNQATILMLQQQLRTNPLNVTITQQLSNAKNQANQFQAQIQIKNRELSQLKQANQPPATLPAVDNAQIAARNKEMEAQQAALAQQQAQIARERAALKAAQAQQSQAANAEAEALRQQLEQQKAELDRKDAYMALQTQQLEEAKEKSIAQEAELQASTAEWSKERQELEQKRTDITSQLRDYKAQMEALPTCDKLELPTGDHIEYLTGEQIEIAYGTLDFTSMSQAQAIQQQYQLLLQQQALIEAQAFELEQRAANASGVHDETLLAEMTGTVVLAWSEDEIRKRDEKIDEFFSDELKGFKMKSQNTVVDTMKLRAKFEAMDVDRDGHISMQQLVDFLMDEGLDEGSARSHVKGFYRMVDFSTTENINFDAFVIELDRMQMFILMRSIQATFYEVDKNKDGELDRAEFCELLEKHYRSEKQAKLMADKVFDDVDIDRNGSLSLKEVATWYFTTEVSTKATQDRIRNGDDLDDDAQVSIAMKKAEIVNTHLANGVEADKAAQKQRIMERKAARRRQKEQ